jgi:superfamily II DNA/RNA helicase
VRALRQQPEVVVACPGRLLDLLGQGALRLNEVEVLVLDEADHMFDMGFLPDLRRILKALPARRQNLLFSATMPPEIRKLADSVLYKPAVIELGNSRPAETIAHALYPVAESDKVGALERMLGAESFRSAIVFLRTKRRAKQLAQRLEERGRAAIALQSNMSQPQRERALNGFREGRYDVLVATDIAARGLDIVGVSHVVNFDVPNTPDAYTHRIGRTGRSECTGTAFTFVTPEDGDAVRAIEKRLGAKIERRPLSELGPLESGTLKGRAGGRQQSGRGPRRSAARPSSAPRPKRARETRFARSAGAPQPATQASPVAAAAPVRRQAFGQGVNERPDRREGASGGAGRPRRRRA